MWKNVVESRQAIDDNVLRRLRFACWITKDTNTHSEYVIFIAFSRQQKLCEHAPECFVTRILRTLFNKLDGVCVLCGTN